MMSVSSKKPLDFERLPLLPCHSDFTTIPTVQSQHLTKTLHRTVVVTPTIFAGTFPPWNSAHPVPKKVTPKTLHHGTPVKTAKCSKHQKLGTYKAQWNRSHTHLERGTFFIKFQMGLHLRTAWNAAFTTLNISCSKLTFLPDCHLSFRG